MAPSSGSRLRTFYTFYNFYVHIILSFVCPDTLDLLGQLILHQHLVFDKAIYHFGLVQDIVYDYISEEIVDES